MSTAPHPDGGQLAEISGLLGAGRIGPVFDHVLPFDWAEGAYDLP